MQRLQLLFPALNLEMSLQGSRAVSGQPKAAPGSFPRSPASPKQRQAAFPGPRAARSSASQLSAVPGQPEAAPSSFPRSPASPKQRQPAFRGPRPARSSARQPSAVTGQPEAAQASFPRSRPARSSASQLPAVPGQPEAAPASFPWSSASPNLVQCCSASALKTLCFLFPTSSLPKKPCI